MKEPVIKEDSTKEMKKEEKKEEEDGHEEGATLFVKNLNFVTVDSDLKEHFESCGEVRKKAHLVNNLY